jgi:hypothetical protein
LVTKATPEDSIADLLLLIPAEYAEMPGLRLTLGQVCRLFGIGPRTGETVMQMLVDAGILARTATGAFVGRRTLN